MIKKLFLCFIIVSSSSTVSIGQNDSKVILVRNQSRDLKEFRIFVEQAARLKKFGEVQMEVSALADKSWYEIPEGGSPWHEYCDYISTPWKFFPHPDIAKHLPKEWVKANRELLMKKVKIVREYGLVPFMYAKSVHFLPESFFQEYPELRGPRVDHPRRSNREEFTWCTDLPETRAYISWMITEIKKNIPDLKTIITGFNDSGSGLCWADQQYPGSNGPTHCKNISTSERVIKLSETIHKAAIDGGGDITFRFGNVNFSDKEDKMVLANLPLNTYFNEFDEQLSITGGTQINRMYPFKGLVDPLEVLEEINKLNQPEVSTILIRFADQYYGRSDDSPEGVNKFIDVFEAGFGKPLDNLNRRFDKLNEISVKWGGEKNKDLVFEAFYKMHNGIQKVIAIAPSYYRLPLFIRVSLRYINRPLLFDPQALTPEEEAYFLPFVFNRDLQDARTDYIDTHGGRRVGTPYWQNEAFQEGLKDMIWAANALENVEGAPGKKWLNNVSLSLRMYASYMRSIDNFYHAQLIRDRHIENIALRKKVNLVKDYSWSGDPDFIPFNNIMRDEYDNTLELINILENGGLQYVVRSKDQKHEDTFLLGPNILEQIKMKAKLMRDHWLDIEIYLVSPLK